MTPGQALQEITRLDEFFKEKFPTEAATIGTQNGTGPISAVDLAIKLLTKAAPIVPLCGALIAEGPLTVCNQPATVALNIEKVGAKKPRDSILSCAKHADAAQEFFKAALYSVTVKNLVAP